MAEMTLQQALETASAEHRAGRLDSAQRIYEQILQYQPTHLDTLVAAARLNHQLGRVEHAIEYMRRAVAVAPDRTDILANLGMLQAMTERFDEALPTLRRALALNPKLPEVHNNLGNVLRQKGDLPGAIAAYQTALHHAPNYVDAQVNLGIALVSANDPQAAIPVLQRAAGMAPENIDVRVNLGEALRREGRNAEAIPLFQAAMAKRPNEAEIPALLGQALIGVGDVRGAIEAYQRAVSLNPNHAEALSYMSVAYAIANDLDAAYQAAGRAVQIKPTSGEVQNNWGHILQKLGRADEAIAAYRESLKLTPHYPEPQNNIASTLWDTGKFEEALAEMHKASAMSPGHAAIDANLGMMMLTLGDFENGWRVYEARLEVIPGVLDKQTAKPRWDGSDPAGKTIVLESEQGFGDSIQFARYVPMLAARGARVIVQCQPHLKRLLQTVAGVGQIVLADEPLPQFDAYARMLSLPGLFNTDLATIPASVPYVSADPLRVVEFRERLAAEPPGFKVGIAWAGNPVHGNDRDRSIAMQALAPLALVPGIRFFSLQKGEASRQAQLPLGDATVIDWTNDLTDFADTAALVQNLDLVISIDSAVAHLAGALAAKTWVLVQYVPDWRWLLNRTDSPWYPTMRLFRQSIKGSWNEPIAQMAEGLRDLAAGR
jgi:tetratricopeptide (TPR) repeat protein